MLSSQFKSFPAVIFANSLDPVWIQTVRLSDSVPEKEFLEKVNFEKSQQTTTKAEKLPSMKIVKLYSFIIHCLILDVFFQGGHYDAKDFLCYYYYGGMIYTALKQYDRALYFFEIVSMVVSKLDKERNNFQYLT